MTRLLGTVLAVLVVLAVVIAFAIKVMQAYSSPDFMALDASADCAAATSCVLHADLRNTGGPGTTAVRLSIAYALPDRASNRTLQSSCTTVTPPTDTGDVTQVFCTVVPTAPSHAFPSSGATVSVEAVN